MSRPFDVQLEQAYVRKVLFSVELLDAVDLSRVNQGVEVRAEGLDGRPIVNASGLFVWLEDDFSKLQRLSVNPRQLPYESVTLAPSQVQLPLTTVQLAPLSNYRFPPGVTGVMGMLIATRVTPPLQPAPVANAEIRLRWLDEDGFTWRESPVVSHTDASGNFAAVLRFAPGEVPGLDSDGTVNVRLRALRDSLGERISDEFKLLQSRMADPATYKQGSEALIFAWDELQP